MRLEIKRGFSSPPVTIGLLMALAAAPSACANPECPAGEKRIGTRCEEVVRLPDGAVVPVAEQAPSDGGGDEAAPERAGDASATLDATSDLTSGRDGGLVDVAPELDAAREPDEQADADASIVPAPSDVTGGDVPDAAMSEPMPAEPPPDPTTPSAPPPEQPVVPASCMVSGACTAGADTSCTTTCGTSGSGTCSATCEPPAIAACTPPAEACNGIDDDCDGVTDFGLFAAGSNPSAVWTEPLGEFASATTTLLRRPGGYWLINRPWGATIGLDGLDAGGRPDGRRAVLGGTDAFGRFAANSDGKWIAFLFAAAGSTSTATHLQLYNAADGTLVSATEIVGDRAPCGQVFPDSVGVTEVNGTVYIAASRYFGTAAPIDGVCNYVASQGSERIIYATYSAASGWSLPRQSELEVPSPAIFGLTAPLTVSKVPCRDEWIVAHVGPDLKVLRRYNLHGVPLSSHDGAVADLDGLTSITGLEGDCSSGVARIAAATLQGMLDSPRASIRMMSIEPSGAFSTESDRALGEDVLFGTRVVGVAGRGFAAAIDSAATVHLYEFAPGTATRALNLSQLGMIAPEFKNYSEDQQVGTFALRVTSGGLSLAASTGSAVAVLSTGWPITGLDSLKPAGDPDPVSAVTYRVGCQ